jgi:hypothetical protein
VERLDILKGFLKYRLQLHSIGIVTGFQWLNGSFLENVEIIRGVAPQDIDVTTFFYLPNGIKSEEELGARYPELFDPQKLKQKYHVDGYSVCLHPNRLSHCIQQTNYWYSVWSHQRDTFHWKGFVQIDLDPLEDQSLTSNVLNHITEGFEE